MRRLISYAAALIAAFVLVACGGGGSSSAPNFGISSTNIEITAIPNIKTSVAEVTLSAHNFDPADLVITGLQGAPIPDWLSVEYKLEEDKVLVSANSSAIADGQTYKTTLQFVATDTKGNRYTRDVTVTVTTGGLKFSANEVNLSTAAGTISDITQVNFSGENFGAAKTARITKWYSSAWLKVQPIPINGYVNFHADATNLAAGTYTDLVLIEMTDAAGKTLIGKMPVTLTVTGANSTAPSTVTWNTYNGDLAPDTANALTLASGANASFTRSGGATGGITAANGIATLNVPADNVQYRYDLPYSSQYPKKMTFAARVKADSAADALRALAIEANFADSATTLAANAARVKLTIYGNEGASASIWQGLTIERCDNTSNLDGITTWGLCNSNNGAIAIRDYHVYQVSITLTEARKGYLKVYVDGAATPLVSYGSASAPLTFRAAAGDGANYIHFGDMNTAAHKSYIDWLIWTTDDAYTPSQLKGKLPANIGEIPAAYQ
jgi:hypothetical protein